MTSDSSNLPALKNWLKFRHLSLIATLARTANMHTTAEQMGLSQPAVSKMLRDIEELFGFPLFERLPRELQPSELGLVVIQYAERTLNDAQRFTHQLDTLRKGGHGYVKIGAIFAATAAALPEALAEIKRRRPMLVVELVEQTSDHLLHMLEHKQLDLVVGRFTQTRQQHRFDFQPLAEEPFWLVANRTHPLSERRDIPAAELTQWPWVLYPLDTPMRQMLEQVLSQLQITPPNNIIETTSVQTTQHLLQHSQTLALLPEAIARQQVEQGRLCVLSTPLTTQPLSFGILTRKHETPSGNAQELIEILLAGRALD
ncbi:LysR substrate-binding domain-containing protein [Ectopseudomonas toyotomiensis]|uniref:LysR substrate-binding domain-containing protein n=1 Tax=Ectopseudomonas toyotomiensis TaxID=554344 RepID=UPI003D0FFDD0